MTRPGPRNDLTDVEGLLVGQTEHAEARTGVTVVLADRPAVAAVDVRGGGPGTRETDLLRPGNLVEAVDAVALSGGSVYGLAAADGVVAHLAAIGRGFALVDDPAAPRSPIVPGAILFDLANGGDKAWGDIPPYRALGRAAAEAAGAPVRLGRAGAGFGARAGSRPGGDGSASAVTHDGLTVAALVSVNSFGSTTMPGTEVFWAWPWEIDGEFGGARPDPGWSAPLEDWSGAKLDPRPGTNTTIAVVATDADLTRDQARRVAMMAQDGLARAIRPVHAPFDGDVVFALSTARKPLPDPAALSIARLGALAADCLARAVARGVRAAA